MVSVRSLIVLTAVFSSIDVVSANSFMRTNGNYSQKHHRRHLWDCDRPWPQLELFLPVQAFSNSRHKRYYEAEISFLRSFTFFWPLKVSNTSLMVAYDLEAGDSEWIRQFRATVDSLPVKITGGVKWAGIPPFPYYKTGHDRQQYDMFWADNFTEAEYVGFVDTDCAFITYVDREDLFEDGKPVVVARGGFRYFDSVFSNVTYNTLGILEPFRTMSYFPVIIKTSHLALIRNFIAKHHNMSFDEVFRTVILAQEFSQFNIICTYLWAHHRDEYVWYVQSESPDWDGLHPPPVPGQDGNLKQFTEQMKQPKPRIATHVNYRSSKEHFMPDIGEYKHVKEMNEFMLQGYCYSPPFPHSEAYCREKIDVNKYHFEMHNFEQVPYEKLYPAESLHYQARLRHQRVKHCNHTWNVDELQAIMKL